MFYGIVPMSILKDFVWDRFVAQIRAKICVGAGIQSDGKQHFWLRILKSQVTCLPVLPVKTETRYLWKTWILTLPLHRLTDFKASLFLSQWIQNCQYNLITTLRELLPKDPLTKRKNVAIQVRSPQSHLLSTPSDNIVKSILQSTPH